jgi:3D (Asp-Asp-Asp) domain-containing protein
MLWRTKSLLVLRSAALRGLLEGLRGRAIPLLVCVGIGLVVVATGAAERPRDAAALRQDAQTLAAKRERALLQLYAAETQVRSAQARLASVEADAARVRADRAQAQKQAGIAQHALQVSQAQLAERLRALYVQGEPDALAVVLGATSLDDALTGIEAIKQSGELNQRVIGQTTAARRTYDRLSAMLARRSAQLDALTQQAAASLASVSALRGRREGVVASLREREALTRRQIARLEVAARAAQAKTQDLASTESAPPANTADPASAPDQAAQAATSGATITVTATGYSLPGRTATGLPVGWGVAAVDPSVIPLGTRMTVPGYGEAVAADVGSGVQGATIDLWFPTLALARAWGRRTVVIALH